MFEFWVSAPRYWGTFGSAIARAMSSSGLAMPNPWNPIGSYLELWSLWWVVNNINISGLWLFYWLAAAFSWGNSLCVLVLPLNFYLMNLSAFLGMMNGSALVFGSKNLETATNRRQSCVVRLPLSSFLQLTIIIKTYPFSSYLWGWYSHVNVWLYEVWFASKCCSLQYCRHYTYM